MTDPMARLGAALADRYRLERELGQGGMATVYLAADLKHDRQVAIKVLKPDLAAVLGSERFITEIKTTAALSHPHILPLFDSGEAGGFLYYVMPYIQGETIRERLNRETQLGIEDAVRITSEVADALDYAHQHGVIHRDIKPENILLHAGRPMVMDFGIALAVSAAAGGRMTETGLSLGTPHYMSPEQATADKEITGRSDIYSLASVLYEMLAGVPPHDGGSAQQVIMRIIAETPKPVGELRRSVPPNVAAALGKALEKLPADRFDSARAFAEALANPHFVTMSTAAAAPALSASGLRQWLRNPLSVLALASLLLGAGLLSTLAWRQPAPPVPEPVMAFVLADSLPARQVDFALTDDGTIIFSRPGQGLYVRWPGELEETLLPGTETVAAFATPVVSPGGTDVVYAAGTQSGRARHSSLRRTSLRGGASSTLWTSGETSQVALPLAWEEDGWIYINTFGAGVGTSMASTAPLSRVRASGGAIEPVAAVRLWEAVVLPGGKALVGCHRFASGDSRVLGVNLASGDTVHIASDACSPRWSPTGHLLVAGVDGTLRALPFDPDRLAATGPPLPLLEGLAILGRRADYQVSQSGTLVYVSGPADPVSGMAQLTMVGLDGGVSPISLPPTGDRGHADLSPDGRMLAYIRDDQVWLYDLELGSNRQLTTVGRLHMYPIWSPDGTRVAYHAARPDADNGDVYVQAVSGDSVGVHVGGTPGSDRPTQWLPDGRLLVASLAPGGGARFDVFTLTTDRRGAAVPILQADWSEEAATVSPDGKWLAYLSDESGRHQLIVRAWPGLDRKSVIADSAAFSSRVTWAPDSRTLYYRRQDDLMAASLTGTDSLRLSSSRVAFAGLGGPLMAMHPDGRRFLVLRAAPNAPGQSARRSLIAITGWNTLLRQRLAAGGTP